MSRKVADSHVTHGIKVSLGPGLGRVTPLCDTLLAWARASDALTTMGSAKHRVSIFSSWFRVIGIKQRVSTRSQMSAQYLLKSELVPH
jgi:hypothetical protein